MARLARAKSEKGMIEGKCNFNLFSEGLHVLQDSWSHQGKPYWYGLGHARGAYWRELERIYLGMEWTTNPDDMNSGPRYEAKYEFRKGGWFKLKDLEAALDYSADYASLWPEDVREAAIETYKMLLDFKENCPCACPGPTGNNAQTSSGEAQDLESKVKPWLTDQYPGNNKVN